MNSTRIDTIQYLCLAYMVAWGISPPLQVGTAFRSLFVLCFLIWDLIAINRCGSELLYFELKLFSFLFFMFSIGMIADGFNSSWNANVQFILFFCYLNVFWYFYITKENYYGILILILLLFAIWNISTLRAYVNIRNISRLMSKDFEGNEKYLRRGIGGYGYVYSVVLLIPILLGLVIRPCLKNKSCIKRENQVS